MSRCRRRSGNRVIPFTIGDLRLAMGNDLSAMGLDHGPTVALLFESGMSKNTFDS
ncbi:MAG: hypothetical protein LH628_18790 [Microcoleus sp. CAN_BIN18]|nr:hypothetical protein [Microcoleus sp. CAN_BIN18]